MSALAKTDFRSREREVQLNATLAYRGLWVLLDNHVMGDKIERPAKMPKGAAADQAWDDLAKRLGSERIATLLWKACKMIAESATTPSPTSPKIVPFIAPVIEAEAVHPIMQSIVIWERPAKALPQHEVIHLPAVTNPPVSVSFAHNIMKSMMSQTGVIKKANALAEIKQDDFFGAQALKVAFREQVQPVNRQGFMGSGVSPLAKAVEIAPLQFCSAEDMGIPSEAELAQIAAEKVGKPKKKVAYSQQVVGHHRGKTVYANTPIVTPVNQDLPEAS